MRGQHVSGTFGCPTPTEQHRSQLERKVEQQWRAVSVLRAEKNCVAARELAALRSARQTERVLRALELQIAAQGGSRSRSWQP